MTYLNMLFVFFITLWCSFYNVNSYVVDGKIALVTGGAHGIGLEIIKSLLNNNVTGVTLVDVSDVIGRQTAKKLNHELRSNKVMFVRADVSNHQELEYAFKVTKQHWGGLDIVINNAGIMNEVKWPSVISVNSVGTLQGTLLGFEYMSEGKGGRGGVVINVASIAGLDPEVLVPVYSATKAFIVSLGRSLGSKLYYNYNKVRVITLCPGYTDTNMMADVLKILSSNLLPNITDIAKPLVKQMTSQPVEIVAQATLFLLSEGKNGDIWVSENKEMPYQVVFPDRNMMRVN